MARSSKSIDLWQRAADAVGRRTRYWLRTLRGTRPPAVEAAWRRLIACARDDGLSPTCGTSAVCPGLTAAAIPTLRNFGDADRAWHYARRLLQWQKRDGSLPDAGLLHSSLFNTAQAARAWAVSVDDGALPEAEPALRRACGYLVGRICEDGTVRLPEGGGSFDRWAPPPVHLAGLATAAEHARRHGIAGWRSQIGRAIDRLLRTSDCALIDVPTHIAAHGLEAIMDLSDEDPRTIAAAIRGLESAAVRQRRDGSIPIDGSHRWTSSAGLAHLTALWFRAGMQPIASKGLECLIARQADDGGWPGSWGRGAAFFPHSNSNWTIKYFLDAAAAQVAHEFDDPEPGLSVPLATGDGRWEAARRWAAEVPDGGVCVDVGCGGGRFLSALAREFPRLEWSGIDPSATLLKNVPAGIDTTRGNLLRLPIPDARCSAALCIEALEHSLLPERAVDELCRIVHPGGRVLIVDKCARFQGLSECKPWERWFTPESVSHWLAKHCDDVTCEPLPTGPHQRTPGLFLTWRGVRRAKPTGLAVRRAA